MPEPWNPTTEPAFSVKAILTELSKLEVFRESTMEQLGLSSEVVQTAMNTHFFPGGQPSLTEEQCGRDVSAGQIVLSIDSLTSGQRIVIDLKGLGLSDAQFEDLQSTLHEAVLSKIAKLPSFHAGGIGVKPIVVPRGTIDTDLINGIVIARLQRPRA
jgi:hypothetical protein